MSLHLAIDHVVILVPDLEGAGSAFEDAGFHVTRQTRHSPAMGTANRCVMLEGSYIEIMGIVAETPANATWRSLLDAGAGIRGLALRSTDIEASARDLSAIGVAAQPVRHFSRMTEDGELRFSISRVEPDATPGLQCLVCQHHTAELLWRPETMIHANGASSLASIILPDAQSLSALPADEEGQGIDVTVGRCRLVLSGRTSQCHDLRTVCGVEIDVAAA